MLGHSRTIEEARRSHLVSFLRRVNLPEPLSKTLRFFSENTVYLNLFLRFLNDQRPTLLICSLTISTYI